MAANELVREGVVFNKRMSTHFRKKEIKGKTTLVVNSHILPSGK
jgi:hypothetical protein